MTLQEKEDNFTLLLQQAARKLGCYFIEESGEGHDLETDDMYLEDVGGWLVPNGTPEGEAKTNENYRFAEWELTDSGEVKILFNKY